MATSVKDKKSQVSSLVNTENFLKSEECDNL